ncbi:MAG: tyrosine-type recombinase/integrase [Myxococcota bacterium]
MAVAKLTKRIVEGAKRPTGEKGDRERWIWDTEVKGLGVKLNPSGRRSYVVKYRPQGERRTRKVTIGAHGQPWTVYQAREEARRLLGAVAAGEDPAQAKREAREALTVAELCELWLAEGCTTKKASTIAEDRRRIECHVLPLLGSRKVDSVTRGDVERFLRDVANGKTARKRSAKKRGRSKTRGGKGVATRTVGMLGSIFTFAVARGLRPDNPARGVKRFPDQKRERFLSEVERARLGEALSEAEAEGVNPSAINAIRLLALTGCRRSEVLGLRWEWVDFDFGCLRLPDSKTRAKVVPLGAPAAKLLGRLPRVEGNPHVFPGAEPGEPFKGLQKVWRRIRERAGLEDVRLHDLRHTFASVGAEGGSSLVIIGAILGHRHAATTSRYAHLSDDPVKAQADRIAARIASTMDPGEGAEVVPIKSKRG